MKKICIVTAARSEYGHLKWLIHDLQQRNDIETQVVVTGGHLDENQGHTIDEIIVDNVRIAKVVDVEVSNSSAKELTDTMGRYMLAFSEAFNELNPDILVVLGDRYELLPICSVAFIQGIKIAHISGGDVTEGALDDNVRNTATMLATYHFPGNPGSAKNIERMRNSSENIYSVGEPSLEAFNRITLLTREQLAENLGLVINKKWALLTLHSETTKSIEYNVNMADALFKSISKLENYQIVITKANTDLGGKEINDYFESAVKMNSDKFKIIPSLGQLRYLSYMKQVDFVIGNSSSGIVESPFLSIPTVNIGDRQKGRYQCDNIVQSDVDEESITESIKVALEKEISPKDKYFWGDGNTAEKIIRVICE